MTSEGEKKKKQIYKIEAKASVDADTSVTIKFVNSCPSDPARRLDDSDSEESSESGSDGSSSDSDSDSSSDSEFDGATELSITVQVLANNQPWALFAQNVSE